MILENLQELIEVTNEVDELVVGHTTATDFLLAFIGWLAMCFIMYLSDRRKFESKKHLLTLNSIVFLKKYYPLVKDDSEKIRKLGDWETKKWNRKTWWESNDEKIYISIISSIVLIIGIPQTWYWFSSFMGWEYVNLPILSVIIGYYGASIWDLINLFIVSLRKKIKRMWDKEDIEEENIEG